MKWLVDTIEKRLDKFDTRSPFGKHKLISGIKGIVFISGWLLEKNWKNMKTHIFEYHVINGSKSVPVKHDEIAEFRSESTINADLKPIRDRLKLLHPKAELITLNHKILHDES